jgi:hypothetical protein
MEGVTVQANHVRRSRWAVSRRRLVAASAALGATCAIWAAASAGSPGSHVHTTLWADKADCGSSNTDYARAGGVGLSRSVDDVLTVNYQLRGGAPNTVYTVDLYVFPCSFYTQLGTVTTNDRGSARGEFTENVDGETEFFVYGYSNVDDNETVTVTAQ